ncbi:MAG: AMP-binding protein [Opitutaceae bacterium]|nr:AMP-binding protein [Opitutaceae bacterium]
MGTFVDRAARRLSQPAVRRADDGTDWRGHTARASAAALPECGDAGPLLLRDPDPLAYSALAVAALASGRDLFLGNPHWTLAETAAAETLCRAASPTRDGVVSHVMIATGGSGGALRFAIHTPATLTAAADALQAQLGGGPINSLCLLPLHHVSGFQQLVRALATDGTLLLGDWPRLAAGSRPDLPATGDWMLSLVPTQLQRLIGDPAACAWLRSFTTILLGGAPASAALLDQARTAGLPLAQAYGATETAAVAAWQSPADFLAGGSGLRPLPHAALRVLHPESGLPVAPSQLGRIEVVATSLFLGYWPKPRPSGPWLTDDLGTFCEDGRLQIAGRTDAAINTGGEKVQPAEVESALRATGAFSEVLVFGVPDSRWGETVAAVYPAADRPDLAAVEHHLRAQLSAPKLPRRWVPVADWPRTAQGKTDRAALRRLAAASA